MSLENTNTKWASIDADEDGTVLHLQYDKIPEDSIFSWNKGNRLKVVVKAEPDTEQWWWNEWSTTNDCCPPDAEKTLYIGRFGEELLEPLYHKEQIIKSLELKIVK